MDTEHEEQDSWKVESEPQLMLRVNCSDRIKLLPYAYLIETTLEEGRFLKLEFSSCVIEITGTELEEMLPLFQKHLIGCIQPGNRVKVIKVSDVKKSDP